MGVGRLDDAVAQWQQALAEQPRYARRNTVWPTCVSRGATGLEALIGRLPKAPATAVEIEVLCARLHNVRGEYTAARQMLEEIITRHPRAVGVDRAEPCAIAGGRDWPGAERALRAVLELDPHHAVSRQNLAVLLREHGQ